MAELRDRETRRPYGPYTERLRSTQRLKECTAEPSACFQHLLQPQTVDRRSQIGVTIRGECGDIDPLNNVPSKRARSRAKKGDPLKGSP